MIPSRERRAASPRRWQRSCLGPLAGLLASCATLPPAETPAPVVPAPPGREMQARLLAIAHSLVATPYEFSGDGPEGFDCSGFTSYVFARAGARLPRTVREQAAIGAWVPLDELVPGDLVFFGAARDQPEHVGLVVSTPGETPTMIHAAKSRGVIESDVLASTYWLGQLQFARRPAALLRHTVEPP